MKWITKLFMEFIVNPINIFFLTIGNSLDYGVWNGTALGIGLNVTGIFTVSEVAVTSSIEVCSTVHEYSSTLVQYRYV